MRKNDMILDLHEHLKNMEIISQRDIFEILSILAKCEHTSFTELRNELKLNPNSLSKHLKKLVKLGMIKNYYEKKESRKNYSFYEITRKGRDILHLNLGVPRIRELLGMFKAHCNSMDWNTSESDDWVETESGYHNFLWARVIHPSSFKRIATNRKCVVREGLSYRVAEASYTAWLFSEAPSETLIRTIFDHPDFSRRIAIYDLSQAYLAEPNIKVFNRTKSEVFREFENYSRTEWNLDLVNCSYMEVMKQSRLLRKEPVKRVYHSR